MKRQSCHYDGNGDERDYIIVMTVILFLIVNAFQFVPVHYGAVVSVFEATPLFRHAGNTRKAEEFNQAVWESGFADIYTIKATIEVNDEMRSIAADVICAPKMETQRANIKGGPYVWDLTFNFDPPEIYIKISENYRVVIDTHFSCKSISLNAEKLGYPFIDRSYQTAVIQHIGEPVLPCTQSLYEGEILFKELRIFPLEVMSIRQERVSDVITRDDYGPTDRANKPRRGTPSTNKLQVSDGHKFVWSDKKMCWMGRGRGLFACPSLEQNACPLTPQVLLPPKP